MLVKRKLLVPKSRIFEYFSALIFSFEYTGRFWSFVEDNHDRNSSLRVRIKFLFSFPASVDLSGIYLVEKYAQLKKFGSIPQVMC